MAPGAARARLAEYAQHPETTAADRWAMTAAGRDFYTPGLDAPGLVDPAAQNATMADVAPDGAHVCIEGQSISVPTPLQPAVARLRTRRRIAGCLAHEPVAGILDHEPGTARRRRR